MKKFIIISSISLTVLGCSHSPGKREIASQPLLHCLDPGTPENYTSLGQGIFISKPLLEVQLPQYVAIQRIYKPAIAGYVFDITNPAASMARNLYEVRTIALTSSAAQPFDCTIVVAITKTPHSTGPLKDASTFRELSARIPQCRPLHNGDREIAQRLNSRVPDLALHSALVRDCASE